MIAIAAINKTDNKPLTVRSVLLIQIFYFRDAPQQKSID